MAIDGAFLHCLKTELRTRLSETRVDKIHQPSKEELVFSLRDKNGTYKLYMSARVNSPRVHLTNVSLENPLSPPMFCMLLRKRLTGARLVAIRQPGLERVLFFDFDTYNELGDPVRLTLAAEVMGRYSNIIFMDENGRIIDALKRVDFTMSPTRPLLPGMAYALPPVDRIRLELTSCSAEEMVEAIVTFHGTVEKALLALSQGMSPLICREVVHRAFGDAPVCANELTAEQKNALATALLAVADRVRGNKPPVPFLVYKKDGAPLDFSFMPITQYGLDVTGREMPDFSGLLDEFYKQKDAAERMHQRSHDVLKLLSNAVDRLTRKLQHQRQELEISGKREEKRLYADLINANMHLIKKGAAHAELVNYYDPDCPTVRVPLDPSLSPVRNAQKYYKEYRKAKTAEEMLTKQISMGEEELRYLDSVFDSLSRATTNREVEEVREELAQTGYLHLPISRKKQATPTKPLCFVSQDGFTILVGRNNAQNDKLTTRTAKGSDWWFHTKNIPGSHVVILTDGVTPPETTLMQAAVLAATHSKAADSAQVPVDYTQIKHVKKPAGAKPGMVIYETNRTVYVTPDKTLATQLLQKGE